MIDFIIVAVATVVGVALFFKLYNWILEVQLRNFKRGFHSWSAKDLDDWLVANPEMDMKFLTVCEEIDTRKKMGISDDSYLRARNEQPKDYAVTKCTRVGYSL